MADIRIKDLAVTASSSASDDYLAVDGSTNGTRKLSAYSPTFGGNLTVSGGSIVNGSSTSVLYFGNPSNNYLYYDGSSLFCRIGGSDRFTIPSGTGNFLIGTTTDGGQKLQVNGTAYVSGNATFAGTVSAKSSGYSVAGTFTSGAGDLVNVVGTNGAGYGYVGTSSNHNFSLLANNVVGITLTSAGNTTFAGSIAIGNTVQTAVSVASTHKVTISIGGSTYYLLATNV